MTTDTLSDREIDALLAERLFGQPFPNDAEPPDEAKALANQLLSLFEFSRPRYSSTGDGMLLVESELHKRGYIVETTYGLDVYKPIGSGTCHARIYRPHTTGAWIEYADSLPRAVAEAAIRALDAEGETR